MTPFLEYRIRHIQRFRLGTPYPEIVREVIKVLNEIGEGVLAVDGTGVGRPVVDLFWGAGLSPYSITITGTGEAHSAVSEVLKKKGMIISPSVRDQYTWVVPKRDLVADLAICFQNHLIKISSQLPESKTLINELLNFRVKISEKGHDSYEAWREGIHDDLVLSVAIALWTAIHRGGGNGFFIGLDLGQSSDFTALSVIEGKREKKIRLPGHIPSSVPDIFIETRERSPIAALREDSGGEIEIDLPSLW